MLWGKEDCGSNGDCAEHNDLFTGLNHMGFSPHVFETWILSIIGAILVGLSGIFPLLVVPLESGAALKYGEPAKKLRLMLSFAVGSLLGDVFLHLLPEVWSHMDRDNHGSHTRIGMWVITGLLAFMIIEKLMGDESETQDNESSSEPSTPEKTSKAGSSERTKQVSNSTGSDGLHHRSANGDGHIQDKNDSVTSSPSKAMSEPSKIRVSGYLNLVANVVDNFTHGLAVAASFCISTKVGLATTVAILLHEIPHEVGDFAILLRSGFDKWRAAKAQFFTASGGVFGAITALSAESAQIAGERTAWILPFTSGGFMYIALVTVVPDLLQEKQGWESLKQAVCICLGVLSMVLVTLLFET